MSPKMTTTVPTPAPVTPIAGRIAAGVATAEQVIKQIMDIIAIAQPQIAAIEVLFGVAEKGIIAGVANLKLALESNPPTALTDAQRTALQAEMKIIEAEDLSTIGAPPPPPVVNPQGVEYNVFLTAKPDFSKLVAPNKAYQLPDGRYYVDQGSFGIAGVPGPGWTVIWP